MVTLLSLWLPILLSAVAVYIASSLIHMVLPWHKSDYQQLPDEDRVMASLRALNLGNGNYHAPFAVNAANTRDPAFKEKVKQGPLIHMSTRVGGGFNMGVTLAQWFAYALLIAVFTAAVCNHVLSAGASYPAVFQVAALATFVVYAGAQPIESIWFFRHWSTSLKNVFDALIYALLTGGLFGWLWPR